MKPHATIKFECDIGGLRFGSGKMELSVQDQALGKVDLKFVTPEGEDREMKVVTSFPFDGDIEDEVMKDQAESVVEKLLDKLAFEADVAVFRASHYSDNLRQLRSTYKPPPPRIARENGVIKISVFDSISVDGGGRLRMSLVRVLIVGEEQEEELKAKLVANQNVDSNFRSMYRTIMQSRDQTSKFMLLYMLLMTVVGDDQKSVENWIKLREPTVAETATGLRGRQETIYTRLRNEIAHGSGRKVPIEDTRSEIGSVLKTFQELVKQAIAI